MTPLVTLDDIRRAADGLAGIAARTSLKACPGLSEHAGVPVYLKLESEQPTGAFKLRGAWTFIQGLDPGARGQVGVARMGGDAGGGEVDEARLRREQSRRVDEHGGEAVVHGLVGLRDGAAQALPGAGAGGAQQSEHVCELVLRQRGGDGLGGPGARVHRGAHALEARAPLVEPPAVRAHVGDDLDAAGAGHLHKGSPGVARGAGDEETRRAHAVSGSASSFQILRARTPMAKGV